MNMEEIKKENLQNRILVFLDKNSDFVLIAVLIFALILRLKYLNINSALWFDEAEYLSMAKNWAFDIPYSIPSVRPVLLPFVEFIFYKIGMVSEFPFRLIEAISSLIGIYLIYLLGKELFNKYVGLIASFLLSVFYLHLFFTARILTDVPSTTFWTLIAYLFWKGYEGSSKRYLYFTAIALSLGILLRFPIVLLILVFLIYLLLTNGLKFLKNKSIWVSGIIGLLVLIPYFLWFYQKFNSIAILSTSGYYSYANLFLDYFRLAPLYFHSPFNILLIFFLISLIIVLFDLIIGFNLI